jgi:hypothetical protein
MKLQKPVMNRQKRADLCGLLGCCSLLLLLSTTAASVSKQPPPPPSQNELQPLAAASLSIVKERHATLPPTATRSHPQHFMSTFWSNACSSALNRPLPNLRDYLYTVSGILVRRMRRAAATARSLIRALACWSAAPRFSLTHPRNSPADRLLLLERLRQWLHVHPVASA